MGLKIWNIDFGRNEEKNIHKESQLEKHLRENSNLKLKKESLLQTSNN